MAFRYDSASSHAITFNVYENPFQDIFSNIYHDVKIDGISQKRKHMISTCIIRNNDLDISQDTDPITCVCMGSSSSSYEVGSPNSLIIFTDTLIEIPIRMNCLGINDWWQHLL